MIDDNKIEEAAVKSANYLKGICDFTVINAFEEGFKEGAKWAINEFLKDLWHPADEMPNENNEVICVDKDSRTITYNGIANWFAFCRTHDVTHWLYVDDLLPKEGGEQLLNGTLQKKPQTSMSG